MSCVEDPVPGSGDGGVRIVSWVDCSLGPHVQNPVGVRATVRSARGLEGVVEGIGVESEATGGVAKYGQGRQ
jgi:hypothetical protein